MRKSTPREKISKETWKKSTRIFSYIMPYKGYFFIGFVFLILSSLTSLAFPMLIGDLFGQEGDNNTLIDSSDSVMFVLFIVLMSQAVFSFFRIYLFSIVSENALKDLRFKSYRHLIFSPIQFFDESKVGELTSRIATDVTQLQETFSTTIAEFVRQIITIFGGILMIFLISPRLSFIMLSIIPVITIAAIIFGKFIKKLSKEAQDASAVSNNLIEEALSNIKVVKAFANEYFELGKYKIEINNIKNLTIKGAKFRGLFAGFIILCFFGSVSFIVWRGTGMVSANEISISEFIKFILYTIFIAASFGSISSLYGSIQKAVGATERILDLIEEDEEEIKDEAITTLEKGEISFDNVSFNYPSRSEVDVLKNISFDVKFGEKVALVGSSGSGKSTIASLILRLYNADEGDICFDGKNSSNYSLTQTRRSIAVVPQEITLFSGSILDNIIYGAPKSSKEEVKQAATQANAWEFISTFPEGLDTLVGDRGIQLSGGQKQRIAIARAILKNPKILILDEATSSLDVESEKLVQDALNKLMNDRTTLIIAHRLTTIKDADKILVLENGSVRESGNHDELIAQKGSYFNLISTQNSVVS